MFLVKNIWLIAGTILSGICAGLNFSEALIFMPKFLTATPVVMFFAGAGFLFIWLAIILLKWIK